MIDGERAGLIDYMVDDRGTHLLHTEIDEAKREHGLASWFVQQVLDGIRASGGTLVAECPYVAHWLTQPEHAEYRELLA
jgi:predicted GNAT family acetyltransferase